MANNIAVSGMTIAPTLSTVSCTISIVTAPSSKIKCQGNGVYENGCQVTVTNITVPSAGATTPDPGPYTVSFNATATKTKADGSLVLRVNDTTSNINATPQIPGSPPTPYPITFAIQITNPNQVKVQAL